MTERTEHDDRTSTDGPTETCRLAGMTAFQRDLLWALSHEAPLMGLAVKRSLDEYYDEDVTHSRVYANLDNLVERGLVEKGTRDRRTNEYRLTTAGRRALSRRRAWVDLGAWYPD